MQELINRSFYDFASIRYDKQRGGNNHIVLSTRAFIQNHGVATRSSFLMGPIGIFD